MQSSTGTMMERVSSRNLIGYNILGSYAEARAKNDPSLGIAYPKITCWCSPASRLLAESEHPNAAKLAGLCPVGKRPADPRQPADIPLFVAILQVKMISTA